MKKIFRNLVYQGGYQLLLIILPIITLPIVSRALNPKGIGIYNFTLSIASYFVLIAGIGLANYGVREISLVRKQRENLSNKFWELQIFNAIFAFLSLFLYILMVSFFEYRIFLYAQSFVILAALMDISWLFIAVEDFKRITLANMLIKLISFILIVGLIRTEEDLLLYIIIQSSSLFISQSVLWLFLKKYVDYVPVKFSAALNHFKPALTYFLGSLSITLYTNLNKTLLGIITTGAVVGFFSMSIQLVQMIIVLIGVFDTVMIPRMTENFSSSGEEGLIKFLAPSLKVQMYFTIPAFWGILLTNRSLIDWFFGIEFLPIVNYVPLFAPLLLIMPLGTAIFRQFMLPKNQMKRFNIIALYSAGINIFLNLVLIPRIGIYGAIVSSLVSEVFVTSTRIYDLLKQTAFKFDLKYILTNFLIGFVMFILVNKITTSLSPTPLTTLIQVGLGGLLYLFLTLLFKTCPIFFLRER